MRNLLYAATALVGLSLAPAANSAVLFAGACVPGTLAIPCAPVQDATGAPPLLTLGATNVGNFTISGSATSGVSGNSASFNSQTIQVSTVGAGGLLDVFFSVTGVPLVAERDAVQGNLSETLRQEHDAAVAAGQDADRTREAARSTASVLAAQLDSAGSERAALLARQAKEQTAMAAFCRTTPDKCTQGALQRRQGQERLAADQAVANAQKALARRDEAEQTQQNAVRGALTADLRELHARHTLLEADLDRFNREIDASGPVLAVTTQTADRAAADAAAAKRISQIHRLARFVFNADDNAATMRVLTWFSILAACVLALTGSTLAALHYRALSQPAVSARPHHLARAIRGLITRLRRRQSIVRTVEVVREVVREVPVDRIVERVVEIVKPELVLVPIPMTATESERRQAMARAAQAYPSHVLQGA